MIKPNEVRIGNLVRYGSQLSQVVEIKQDYFCTSPFKDGEVLDYGGCQKKTSPIEITEEWLIKFGFEKLETEKLGIHFILKRGNYTGDPCKIIIRWFEYFATGDSIRSFAFFYGNFMDGDVLFIQNVHQLQNLYFALTSQELTIKN